jgi:hypothetical protein
MLRSSVRRAVSCFHTSHQCIKYYCAFYLGSFLAYVPKMKIGLSNHQSASVCVSLCHSPTNNFWTACYIFVIFNNAIQVDFDAVIFNPNSSTILKWLRFKVISWGHDFQPCTSMIWTVCIFGLLSLHHIQSS